MGCTYVLDRASVLIAEEVACGEFVTPDTILAIEKMSLWEPEPDKDESNPQNAFHGAKETSLVYDFATVPISAKMKLPADFSHIALALRSCGMVASDMTSYQAFQYETTNKTKISMMQVAERKTTSVYGGRGDFSIVAEVGKAVEVSLEWKSIFKQIVTLDALDTDNVLIDTPNVEKVYMTKDCTAYLVNGNNAHFKKVELKLGAEVIAPKDTCPSGAYTKDIKPELMISMAVTEDNEDAFDELQSGAEFNFVIPFFTVDGTKKWEIVAPKCVVIAQKTPENEGIINVERTLECRRVVGDDNFELRAYV